MESLDRLSFTDSPPEVIYDKTKEIYSLLREAYQVKTRTFLPALVTFNSTSANAYESTNTFKSNMMRRWFFGKIPEPSSVKTHTLFLHAHKIPGLYDDKNHIVYLDVAGPHPLSTLIEEVTHAAIKLTRGRIAVPLSELASLENIGGIKGNELAQFLIAKGLYSTASPLIDLDEFFPPISRALYRIEDSSRDGSSVFFDIQTQIMSSSDLEDRKRRLSTLIKHIPYFAAHRLLGNYSNDAKKLLQEHPRLADLSGKELWEKYCVPQFNTTSDFVGSLLNRWE